VQKEGRTNFSERQEIRQYPEGAAKTKLEKKPEGLQSEKRKECRKGTETIAGSKRKKKPTSDEDRIGGGFGPSTSGRAQKKKATTKGRQSIGRNQERRWGKQNKIGRKCWEVPSKL